MHTRTATRSTLARSTAGRVGLFGFFLLLVTACGDQAERPADYRGPIARVVEQSRDLGELFAGARAEAVYEIENRGQAPLTILGSEASCGCTKPVFDRQTAAPGVHSFPTRPLPIYSGTPPGPDHPTGGGGVPL